MPRKKSEEPKETVGMPETTNPDDPLTEEDANRMIDESEDTPGEECADAETDEAPKEDILTRLDREIAELDASISGAELDASISGAEQNVSLSAESEPPPKFGAILPIIKRRTTRRKVPVEAEDAAAEETAIIATPAPAPKTRTRKAAVQKAPPVLTIEAHDEVESQADREDVIWHEIHNAYRTRRMLTGTFGGIERLDNDNTIAIVHYKDQRIVIPLDEMMISLADTNGLKQSAVIERQVRILGNMLGAEIDFVIRGIDSKARSVVASRREAMMKKQKLFYTDKDSAGQARIYESRIVQARVIAVAEQAIRVEVFGVECSIRSGDLTWDWVGDARELHSIGDKVLVKILEVRRDDSGGISIKANVKSVMGSSGRDNLKNCRIQGKYAGKVTGIRKGVVFIRLSTGANAIAHSCLDRRMPGKKDDVSFAVTHIDEDRNVAVGIITRIIKQNI